MKYWIGYTRKRPDTSHQISDMNIKFGFVTSLSYLMDSADDRDIAMKIHHLTETYDDDIISPVSYRRRFIVFVDTSKCMRKPLEWKWWTGRLINSFNML